MSDLSYQMIRSANQAREADEQRTEQRRKNLLILVMDFLTNQGYIESANTLSKETNLDMNRYDVCDNIDLETVLMEYESYYFVRFQKYPKVTKKLGESASQSSRMRSGLRQAAANKNTSSTGKSSSASNGIPRSNSTPTLPRIPPNRATSPTSSRPRSRTGHRGVPPTKKPTEIKSSSEENGLDGLMIQGNNHTAMDGTGKMKPKTGQIIDFRSMINDATRLNAEEGADDRMLKPLGGYLGYSSEWRELAQVISRDIFSSNPNVRWNDIIGLDNAKRIMKEAVVYPIKYPQLFTGILSPWKGLLLYGPPGTGKTLLAKAVATECNTTFFNISASSIVSKWRGDSEKLVRVLFELARFHAPSTIFLDELESLMSQRGSSGAGGEHEGSRRMKTELLVQMDGLSKTDDLVFLLAASNLPWELDHAMLRRLEKRIIVDLPTEEAREAMFKHHLPPAITPDSHGLELRAEIDYKRLAKETVGYSGSDIRLVAKEAAMRPVRKVFEVLEHHTDETELDIKLDPVLTPDALAALAHTKPSARLLTERYKKWQQEYESV